MSEGASLDAYDFELPAERIAQRPTARRSGSRLLRWRGDGGYDHLEFEAIADLLDPRDLLVTNDTRVFPARLRGTKAAGSARIEVLLVRPRPDRDAGAWEALIRPGRRVPPGTRVILEGEVVLHVGERTDEQTSLVHFDPGVDVLAHCRVHGHVPLPPYIDRADDAGDRERYQTVFARREGSVAAPTAGLHFDEPLLARIEERGVRRARITLHVGPGTFRPIGEEELRRGELHAEWREVDAETVEALRACRQRGGRVVAVGTTVCRTLESLPDDARGEQRGDTRLMIRPGHRWRWTDVLVTNFHLPRSSLLLLVAALAGPRWREAYRVAVEEGYRFYSYGDANWIERAGEET